jgi:WD40 repeat protein
VVAATYDRGSTLAYIHRHDVYIIPNNSETLLATTRQEFTKCALTVPAPPATEEKKIEPKIPSSSKLDAALAEHKQAHETPNALKVTLPPSTAPQLVHLLPGNAVLTQCLAVSNTHGEFLVVLSSCGIIHTFDASGQRHLHKYMFERPANSTRSQDVYLQGVCASRKELLFVGTGMGDLLMLQLRHDRCTLLHKMTLSPNVQLTSCALNSQATLLAVGDALGNLFILNVNAGTTSNTNSSNTSNANLELIHSHAPPVAAGIKEPLSSLAFTQTLPSVGPALLCAAYATGHIRLFDARSAPFALLLSMFVHSRPITQLTCHQTKPLILCSSEDSYVSLWRYSGLLQAKGDKLTIQCLIMQQQGKNLGLLCGAQFAGQESQLILSMCYDSKYLSVMHLPDSATKH